jgi:hypothetical protein
MIRKIEVYEGLLERSDYHSGYVIDCKGSDDIINDIMSGFEDKKIKLTIEVID